MEYAPAEWQDRIAQLDPNLRVVKNTLHPDGHRWCIVRFVGEPVMGNYSVPIVGLGEFSMALQRGWSFVRDLEYPDGTPASRLEDMHILDLFRDDWWRKYGRTGTEAKPKLEALQAKVEDNAKKRDEKAFADAFASANTDRTLLNEAVSVDFGRETARG